MECKWLIIPDYNNLDNSLSLAETYGTAFEYNDFFNPLVYEDETELRKRIQVYRNLARDRSQDTLHGVFLDIAVASRDSYIREYSQRMTEQSVAIGEELGVKGVVFHTGLIAELQLDYYIQQWLEEQEKMWRKILKNHPSVDIYMENTFEKSPKALLLLKERLQDEKRFRFCLDYGHACLTPTPAEEWIDSLAEQIGHIHLNDNDLKEDLHLIPGEGAIDFGRYKELMLRYDIQASVLLEIADTKKQKKALEYMRLL